MNQIDEIMKALEGLTPEARADLESQTAAAIGDRVWVPNPGPQTEAYFCEADELFYGGSAGSGKSALIIGLSLTDHCKSLILRRTNKEAEGFVDEFEEALNTRDGYNGQKNQWRVFGKTIDIGGCQLETDKQKHKGRARDLYGFDEISDFTETQYTFIIGWNRSKDPGQRCRVVCAGNPPTRPEGLWVVKRWGAWLDPNHPNPAEPGELRWYTTGESGREIEVDGAGPHDIGGEEIMARSRTFIPGKLSDNPDLSATNYAATLAALPEELRAAYKDGRFDVALKDGAFQAVPTAWVREAIDRWTEKPPANAPMCGMGVDVAQGGKDKTTLAMRHDGWYDYFISVDGKDTPDGKSVAALVVKHRRDSARVVIDMGGGYGGAAYEHLKDNGIDVVGYKGSEKYLGRTSDRQLKLFNKRSAAIWKFREALDPSQPGGSRIMLPDDPELVADLTAPTFKIGPQGIQVEPKVDVCKRLGRSTDKGDAAVMAWIDGLKASNIQGGFSRSRSAPKVVMSKSASKRRRG